MTISVIIPAYNEEEEIAMLVEYLLREGGEGIKEIIVSDGGSKDATVNLAAQAGARVVSSPAKGRAAQMNYGAKQASGDVFYFVHADSYPPPNFARQIAEAVANGYQLGRYKTRFRSNNFLLKLNAWFSRFDWLVCYGGDQTLFVTGKVFNALDGYKENMAVMEEYEFVRRAREKFKYVILDGYAWISARKYENTSWVNVQLANYNAVKMFKKGESTNDILMEYKKRLGR